MTAPLIHPVQPAPRATAKAIEAAIASLDYWSQPKPANLPAKPTADLTPLEQMFAYYD